MIHLLFTQRAKVFHFARDQQRAINLNFIDASFIHAQFGLWPITKGEDFPIKGVVAHNWPGLWPRESEREQARVFAGERGGVKITFPRAN